MSPGVGLYYLLPRPPDPIQEAGLDFAFLRLGIGADSVDHPIIMSERLATPLASRTCALCFILVHHSALSPTSLRF